MPAVHLPRGGKHTEFHLCDTTHALLDAAECLAELCRRCEPGAHYHAHVHRRYIIYICVRAPRNIRPATRARFTSIGRGFRRTGDPAAPYERALPRVFWDETGTLLAPALRNNHVPSLAERGNCITLTATIGRLTPALGEYLQDLPSLEKHGWPRTVKHAVADVRTCACSLRCTLRCWV